MALVNTSHVVLSVMVTTQLPARQALSAQSSQIAPRALQAPMTTIQTRPRRAVTARRVHMHQQRGKRVYYALQDKRTQILIRPHLARAV